MKALVSFLIAAIASHSLGAMVYVESKVLTSEEFKSMGVTIERLPAPETAHDLRIHVTVNPAAGPGKYRSAELVVYDRTLDESFTSSEGHKVGVRDAKRWSKVVRNKDTGAPSITFSVSPSEVPRSYISIHYSDLPPKDGIPVISGNYYLLVSELIEGTNQPEEPTPLSAER